MPSPTYDLFAEAMATLSPIECIYHGHAAHHMSDHSRSHRTARKKP